MKNLTTLLLPAIICSNALSQTFNIDTSNYFAYFKIPDRITAKLQSYGPYIFLSKEKCIARGVADAQQGISYWPLSQQIRHECWKDNNGTISICPVGNKKNESLGNACIDISKSRFTDTASLPRAAKFPDSPAQATESKASANKELAPPTLDKTKCKETIKNHAFWSRGQFECGFEKYSNSVLAEARVCTKITSNSEQKALLKKGFDLFDDNARHRGKEALCADMRRDFPGIYGE